MADAASAKELPALTTQIVAAYVANNTVPVNDLPALIRQVHADLANVGGTAEIAPERPQPAVPIKRSVMPDYIVCLEDGKKLKMLKRHLMTHYQMTPDEYRQKWGLNADYPMVAPNYAEQRRSLAKKIGLGRGTGRRAARAQTDQKSGQENRRGHDARSIGQRRACA